MPGVPTIVASDGPSDGWTGQVWSVDTRRQGWLLQPRTTVFYWARAQDLPTGWTAERVVEKYINDRTKTPLSGARVQRTPIRLGGYGAFDVVFETSQVNLALRICVVAQRVYSAEAMSPADLPDNKERAQFFDSFRIETRR